MPGELTETLTPVKATENPEMTKNKRQPREKTRSCAVPTPGRRETMEAFGYLATWRQEQKLLQHTYWTAKTVDEIHSNVPEAGAIAIQLEYVQEGHQEDIMVE